MLTIPFNKPTFLGSEVQELLSAAGSNKLSGDGYYTLACNSLISNLVQGGSVLLTPSGTAALELAALLLEIKEGDEVIMPSYTFVSTANAFVLRGARIVFVDVRPDTMNLDEALVESAITSRTRAIVPVHYAGVSAEMDAITAIAKQRGIPIVEDAAQAVGAYYKGRPLGSIADLAAFSFHETKNITSGGEGGCLVINNSKFRERAEILREKGTNRSLFFRGEVDKYTWVDIGSSYLPCELQAAYLFPQLGALDEITKSRLDTWNLYYNALCDLANRELISLPCPPAQTGHNAHIFYIKVKDLAERTRLAEFLRQHGVQAVFHYVPLHSSPAGMRFGTLNGPDRFTTTESDKLLRLPLFHKMEPPQTHRVAELIHAFFKSQ
jgi:dTDP-4-amino-4,6-dideoxygalactose transaminase